MKRRNSTPFKRRFSRARSTPPCFALIENIEIDANREVAKAAAQDDLGGYRRLAASERSHRVTQNLLRIS
jgi:hypothetical protein